MSEHQEQRHALILRWLAGSGRDDVVLACAEAELPGALVLPCCLAEVSPAWVAELATCATIHAAVESCARPEASRNHLHELASLTSSVLLDGGPGRGAAVRYLAPPTRRRALLGLGVPADEPPAGTHAERLATALSVLPLREASVSHAARLSVSDACTSCGVCVRSCPSHALVLELADGTATLTQKLDACQSDQACVDMCPEGAITADGAHPWAEVTARPSATLTSLVVVSCRSCLAPFPAADGQAMCRVCRVNVPNPFGVHLPPAAQALLNQRRARHG